ncbi:MAG: glycosyltransferase [Candidatus Acidiferrales bacterium]
MVSAIIPARNEEDSIARAVESVAAQPEIAEVIVVNDQSSDRTNEILDELRARIPKLQVLAAGALPAGWTGKNYAASIGAAAGRGDWLLFTDADTYHLPGSMRCALGDAAEHDAVLVSYSPEQEMETFWERALIPYIYCRLAERYSYARVNNRSLADAAANGQFLLIRRDVYESVGGHGAIASRMLEDVALAEMVKGAGNAIYFSAPRGVVRTRMYRSFLAMWEGWTKNLHLLFGGEWNPRGAYEILVFALLLAIGWHVRIVRMHPAVFGVCVLGGLLIAWHARYALALRRNHFPLRFIQYGLVGCCVYAVARIASWWKNTRGSVVWKGREYPAGTA